MTLFRIEKGSLFVSFLVTCAAIGACVFLDD
jgi:hypothetical protein